MPESKARPNSLYGFEAIGTHWIIETERPLHTKLLTVIKNEVDTFDNEYSRFLPSSLVSELARKGGTVSFTSGVPELFGLYDTLHNVTDGKVTPLIGNAISELGYDAQYSFNPRTVQPVKDYATTLHHEGQSVTLSEPALLDIGAAGKGFLIDRIANLLSEQYDSFTVDGSGDVYTKGPGRVIGLEHPLDASLAIGQIILENGALCASAINRRAWGNGLHHVIDPSTREPTRDVIATWAVAKDTMTADGLATALFFTDPNILAKLFDYQYVLMRRDGSVHYTQAPTITIFD